MEFRTKKIESANFTTPQEMYDDYKNREIDGIHDYQSKMIDLYMENSFDKKDVAIELPTGSGKTLVGLLIGEFRRRKNKEKIVYLCPTNQLVNQTVENSKTKFGINVLGFTGKAKNYDVHNKSDYLSGRCIAVTNYSSLFNINTFFSDPDVIILDDAHSSENYIASNWTLSISREDYPDLYLEFITLIKDCIDDFFYIKLLKENPTPDDCSFFDKVPNIKIINLIHKIYELFEKHTDNTPLYFSWYNIKDYLHACNFYLNWNEIYVRPFIPPTLTHDPFAKARQRLYMSATLGKSGELERICGIPSINRLPMVKDWENKTIGRKYFMFPNASFDNEENKEIIKQIKKIANRILIIVKDDKTKTDLINFLNTNTSAKTFTAKDIEISKSEFINTNNGIAVIANRFDGLDFPNDECRMLILFDLPNATHQQENFLITRMATKVLFDERIKTRIVQALGRCTRSHSDYAAVCIFGHDLMNSLISPTKIIEYNPELQAELEFGYENSRDHNDIAEYIELLNIFLNNREKWNKVEGSIIAIRDEKIKNIKDEKESCYEQLKKSSYYEVKTQYDIWKNDYTEAISKIDNICNILSNPSLKGYRGFWSYIAAYCSYNLYKSGNDTHLALSKKYLKTAANCTNSIKWFSNLIQDELDKDKPDYMMFNCIENIEAQMMLYEGKSTFRYYTDLDNIINQLESNDGDIFEEGHLKIGQLLGFNAFNPSGSAEPDPIWIIKNICIVSEDKIYQNIDNYIPPNDIKQTLGHKNWILENSDKLSLNKDNVEIITIFLTNNNNIEKAAAIHGKEMFHVDRNNFVQWSKKALECLKEMRRTFNGEGNLIWRENLMELFISNSITPLHFINLIKQRTVYSLLENK